MSNIIFPIFTGQFEGKEERLMDVFRTVDPLYVMRLTVGGNLIDFSPINDRDACGDNFSRWNMYGRDP